MDNETSVANNINTKQISLNNEIIAKFIGLYLMKIDIPEDLWQYVKSNIKFEDFPHLQMFLETVLNSFDEKNDIIRQMSIDFIR